MHLEIKETAGKKIVILGEAIFRLPTNKVKQLIRDRVFSNVIVPNKLRVTGTSI